MSRLEDLSSHFHAVVANVSTLPDDPSDSQVEALDVTVRKYFASAKRVHLADIGATGETRSEELGEGFGGAVLASDPCHKNKDKAKCFAQKSGKSHCVWCSANHMAAKCRAPADGLSSTTCLGSEDPCHDITDSFKCLAAKPKPTTYALPPTSSKNCIWCSSNKAAKPCRNVVDGNDPSLCAGPIDHANECNLHLDGTSCLAKGNKCVWCAGNSGSNTGGYAQCRIPGDTDKKNKLGAELCAAPVAEDLTQLESATKKAAASGVMGSLTSTANSVANSVGDAATLVVDQARKLLDSMGLSKVSFIPARLYP